MDEEELQRRREAMEALRQLRATVRARNQDLTAEAADAIAEDVASEAMERVVARVKENRADRSRFRWLDEGVKTVSATEAKHRLGALLGEVGNGTPAIVVEHHGRPRAVIVSAEEWTELSEVRERLRRQEAWERIWELAAEVSARNADLSQEEADALADEIGDEAKHRVALRLAKMGQVEK